jgi:hypothetical protein
MSNASSYLTDLFGPTPDAPSPEPAAAGSPDAPSPEPAAPTAADRAAPAAALDGRNLDGVDLDGAQPDAPDFGPDGWPVGCIDPQDCPTCPGLLAWQDAGGRWRCERCDADALARSMRLADAAARARRRSAPARHTTAPGKVPAATHTRPQGPPGG